MSTECTTQDCGNHTSTYLCTQCTQDLQAWIDKALDILPELEATIAKQDKVTRKTEGGHNQQTHSAPPINIDAMQLKLNMEAIAPTAKAYENDERAAGITMMIQDWFMKAEILVSGEEETFTYGKCDIGECKAIITAPPEAAYARCPECGAGHDLTAKIKHMRAQAKGEPLQPKAAIDFIKEKTRVTIKAADFKNWVKHGHLTYVLDRVTNHNKPQRIYYPGEVFKTAQQMRERRLKV